MSKIKYIGFDMDYTIAGMCTENKIFPHHFLYLIRTESQQLNAQDSCWTEFRVSLAQPSSCFDSGVGTVMP